MPCKLAQLSQFLPGLPLITVLGIITACSPPNSEQSIDPVTGAVSIAIDDPTLRRIEQGQITGLIQDNGSFAWRRIPYALPPVGELRWKPPQPASHWEGIYSATDTIGPCLQFVSGLTAGIEDSNNDGLVGSEDCLYLSVYAPAEASPDNPLPVMLWIFGGGNNSGYAGDYDGGNLASNGNVVVVTINYRLGSLGWFLHPAIVEADATGEDASGNWSTLDTISSLHWVKNNIAAFGGDAGNVTVFGESAGGSNVMSLMTSPLAAGLFHRAIVESGGIRTTPLSQGINYSDDDVAGHTNSSREIINKILVRDGLASDRDAAKTLQLSMSDDDIRTLLYAQEGTEFLKLYNPERARNYPAPKKFRDGTVFVTQLPHDQLASGDYNRVPVILGSNRDERRIYMYRSPRWSDMVTNDPQEYQRSARYVSDRQKLTGVDDLARSMSLVQDDVYTFRFDWDEQKTTADGIDMSIALGAAHSTEMAFVFGDWRIGFVPPDRIYDPATNPGRDRLSDAMMSYWTHFAYTSSPARGRDQRLPLWQPWRNGNGNPKMLILDSEQDGGIRMSDQEITLESLKQAFLAEDFTQQRNRCDIYRDTFWGTPAFDQDEYLTLGELGCNSQ